MGDDATFQDTNGNSDSLTSNGYPAHSFDNRSPESYCASENTLFRGLQCQREPIAIVGLSCRLPGGSSSPEKLWQLLSHGQSGHCKVPHWRYNASGFYHPDSERPGSINSTGGYFIQEEIKNFEPSFFGINNLEATSIDPQQRKLLEVTYECFEDAGVSLDKVSGANVGCYIANFALDYSVMQLQDAEYLNRYHAAGAAPNILANRISHVFNLRGPSFVLDTACSSSLYSLHYACLGLDTGECDSAVVASANLIQSPQHQLLATKAGIISNSSTCRTFDAGADGYGRSEGVGALYLKRLSDAIRDGDSVRAVIRGTSTNSNGKTNGIMLPSSLAQEEVIRKAYARARLDTTETDYVEAHGTGTAVGDPIEVEAISRVFHHRTGRPQLIGSVKTNLGHSEANSGVSSVIKVVLAMENRVIPPTIGIESINPKIDSGMNVKVVQENTPWPSTSCARASVNSFGFGGANSHVVLESPHIYTAHTTSLPNAVNAHCVNRRMILPFSAHTKYSVDRQVAELAKMKLSKSPSEIGRISFTLSEHRTKFPYRGFAILDENTSDKVLCIEKKILGDSTLLKRALAFVFTGQGAQWPQMGRELIDYYAQFRQSLVDLDLYLAQLDFAPSWTILGVLYDVDDPSYTNQPSISQTLCTAIQISLIDLLVSYSIHPRVVVGHSSGEISAAYASGHLTRLQATALAYFRGYVISQTNHSGAMLAVGTDLETAKKAIAEHNLVQKLTIACQNSPMSVTVSGELDAIAKLQEILEKRKIFARKLRTGGVAYHSSHMLQLGAQYEELISSYLDQSDGSEKGAKSRSGCVHMISSVTGTPVGANETRLPSYWRANLERPVLFDPAMRAMFQHKSFHIIEVGPHPSLESPIKQIQESIMEGRRKENILYDCTLQRNKNSLDSILNLVGRLFLQGHDPDFTAANKLRPEEKLVYHGLPPYPWKYEDKPLWKESRVIREFRQRQYGRHDLLGSLVTGGNGSTFLWRNQLSVKDVPWLKDHRFGQTILFPAAGFLSVAIEAMRQVLRCKISTLPNLLMRNVKLFKALPLPDDGSPAEFFTELRRLPLTGVTASSKWWQFNISTHINDEYIAHAEGLIGAEKTSQPINREIHVSEDKMESQALRVWFNKLKEIGLNWGPSFKQITDIYLDRTKTRREAITKVPMSTGEVDDCSGESQYVAHPVVVDAMLQTAIIASTAGKVNETPTTIPVAIDEIAIGATSSMASCDLWTIRAVTRHTGFGTMSADSEIHNTQGQVLFRIKGERVTVYPGLSISRPEQRMPMLHVAWKPDVSLLQYAPHDTFRAYLDKFAQNTNAETDCDTKFLAGCLDLLTHKDPLLRILMLDPEHIDTIEAFSIVLQLRSIYRRCASLHEGTISQEGYLHGRQVDGTRQFDERQERIRLNYEEFDIVIVTQVTFNSGDLTLASILKSFRSHTRLIACLSREAFQEDLVKDNILASTIVSPHQVAMIGGPKPHEKSTEGIQTRPTIYLVGDHDSSAIDSAITAALQNNLGASVVYTPFDEAGEATFPPKCLIVFTVEYSTTLLLERMTPENMERLKAMTDTASKLFWITRGDLTRCARPEASLVLGVARTVMLEQPSIKIATFDIDQKFLDIRTTASNVAYTFNSFIKATAADLEFVQRNGAVHVSRWVPNEELNRLFQIKQESRSTKRSLESADTLVLDIARAGQLETLRFFEDRPKGIAHRRLSGDQVEIEAKSFGMNAKDLYVLSARFNTPDVSCSCEFSGVVTRTGSDVRHLAVGDRVVAMAPGRYRTYETVPEWACVKLQSDEEFEMASALPLVYSTALYALKYRANIQKGESVLIHSAAGGLGIAAIQVAHHFGATVFATVGTMEKRQYLTDVYGISPGRIFNSRDSSFLAGVLAATNGLGVDVVLNSLTGDLLHDSLKACGAFGRFVELGKKDIMESGRLAMDEFRNNLAFVAFDLVSLYYSNRPQHHQQWQSLIAETMQMLRQGNITPVEPLQVFDVSEIKNAFRQFSKASRIGKIAVSMMDPTSEVEVVPVKFDTRFNPCKSYLLIGCFGGIGRSITRWMFGQGARHFVFLSRSGASQLAATELISDLEAGGAQIKTIKGDVSVLDDVNKAVNATGLPIGGVVQASMSLKALLWKTLSHDDWNAGINAKVKGSWNLHHALQGRDAALDFFLLISSVSGTIGSATEPNYCAANAFLDHFARFRRAQGLPATALGLGVVSEVGFVHDHPEMEAVFSRRGLQPITEDEMLQMVDLAITHHASTSTATTAGDDLAHSHILTGLELDHAKAQATQNNTTTAIETILADPRASLLAASYQRDVGAAVLATRHASRSSDALPPEIHDALARGVQLPDAIKTALAHQFCTIIMLPPAQLRFDDPLVGFGLDSMLAAEFRGYLFSRWGVDVPFMTLLSSAATIARLAEIVLGELGERGGGQGEHGGG